MTELRHEVFIEASPERVWSVLADLEAVQHYNPGVTSARYLSAERGGIGASRECQLGPKGVARERVIEWQPMRAIGIELYESPWPLAFMRWRTSLEPSARGTRVTQRMEYRPKFGVFGALMDRLVMRRMLDRTIADVFAGLKRYAESLDGRESAPRRSTP